MKHSSNSLWIFAVIFLGNSCASPVISPPAKDKRPDSVDPRVVVPGGTADGYDSPGGWNQRRDPSDYAAMVRQWRKQSPHYDHKPPATAVDVNNVENKV